MTVTSEQAHNAPPIMEIMKGIPVSSGIAIGRAFLMQRQEMEIERFRITPGAVAAEKARFRKALTRSQKELKKISAEIGREHSYIIDTHLLMLRDRMLIDGVIGKIELDLINAESALEDVRETFRAVFRKVEDEYMRERHSDVEDVILRVMRNLVGHRDRIRDIPREAIIIATDLAPSETAQMERGSVLGFATDRGGKTGHTTIMARSLGIPAVVGLGTVSRKVPNGASVIVDGNAGTLIINPDEKTLAEYAAYREKYRYYEIELGKLRETPAETTDGHRITLEVNIELPHEVDSVMEHGGDGIGLYRTEFLYMNRADLPVEEEHYRTYRKMAEALGGRPATIRTLDLGGDKFLSQIPVPREINPALGLRAIRLCLNQPGLFREQLRGILRASHYGNIKVMFPMISGLEELRSAKALLEESMDELRRRGEPFNERIKIGCMIEIPSAVAVADLLAKECDFFSIGTNDLIQYSLAIDRINQGVAYLYKPLHPAILRTVERIIKVAGDYGVPVAMCGEMAAEPMYSVVLIGLGLTELSMNAIALPRVKKIILNLSLGDAVEMAATAMTFGTSEEVERFVTGAMVSRFPSDVTTDGRQICLL
jgi:phosphotransferase system enzyme I (PtsI)